MTASRGRQHVGRIWRAALKGWQAAPKGCPTYRCRYSYMGRGLGRSVVVLAVLLCNWLPAGARQSASASLTTLQQIATLVERQDLPTAKALVDAALREYPADPALHNYAGVIDAQQGAFESAESHFQTAIRLAPRAVPPYENLGRLYQERSGLVPDARLAAITTYRRLLAVDPGNAEGLYQCGYLLALGGEFAESRALVDRLPDEIRQRPHVLAVIAVNLAGSGDLDGAMAAANALAAHAESTAADIAAVLPAFDHLSGDQIPQQLLELLDRRGWASAADLQRLGQLHARRGRYAEARAVLERAASADGPTPPLLLALARAAVKLEDYRGALGYLAHARALEPDDASVHFLFGMVCVELNLALEAYESLKRAVALAPEDPLINYAMGAVAITRREASESVPYFEKYRQLVPDDGRGRFALGAAWFYSNQFEKARRELEAATAHPEAAAGAHFFLARIARRLNNLDAARQAIEASLRANQGYADAWAELGYLQTRAGEFAAAEQSLQQALAIDSSNYAATVNLATLFSRTRDPRREAQAARLAELQKQRDVRAKEFLRIIEAVP